MGRFKGLPHWCMTDTIPSAYDVESKTAIKMVARLYASYEDLVKDYNNYIDELNKTIVEFETGVISDTTTFKETITKIVHDYIKMIDDKVKIQDATIAEAVDYMKNNIIYAITETVNEMKTSGELAEIVVEGFNDAIARITTLETSLTSVDAKAEKNIDDILDLTNRVKTAENTVATMEGKVNESTYAVDSVRREVNGVKTDMNALNTEVASVKTANTNTNRNVTTLTSRVEDVETGMTSLEGRVETLETTGGTGGTSPVVEKTFYQIGVSANQPMVDVSNGDTNIVKFNTMFKNGNLIEIQDDFSIKINSNGKSGRLKMRLQAAIKAEETGVNSSFVDLRRRNDDYCVGQINLGLFGPNALNSGSIEGIVEYNDGDVFIVFGGAYGGNTTLLCTLNRTLLLIEEI